eukprot:155486-Chlamydomonas_euryale.AAC.2
MNGCVYERTRGWAKGTGGGRRRGAKGLLKGVLQSKPLFEERSCPRPLPHPIIYNATPPLGQPSQSLFTTRSTAPPPPMSGTPALRRRGPCARQTHTMSLLCAHQTHTMSLLCTHQTHTMSLLCALAFADAITAIYSAAKSQSLQRAPLTRPGPGSTALPGYLVAH